MHTKRTTRTAHGALYRLREIVSPCSVLAMPARTLATLKWHAKVNGDGHGLRRAPLVDDGTVYFIEQADDGDAPIVAADLVTGRVRWRVARKTYGALTKVKALFRSSLSGSFAIAAGQLVVPTVYSTLGLDLETGKIAWTAEKAPSFGGITNPSTLVVHGTHVWRVVGNTLYKIAIGTGKIRGYYHGTKAAKLGDGLVGTATHLVLQSTDKKLGFSIAKPDKPAWSWGDAAVVLGTSSPHPILVDDVVVFATNRSNALRAVTVSTGKERWVVEVGYVPQFAAASERIVVASRSGTLACHDLATGAKQWQVKSKAGDDPGKLAIGDGQVFAILPGGRKLEVRDLATGKLVGAIEAPKGDPFAAHIPPTRAEGYLAVHTRAGLAVYSSSRETSK